MPTESELKAIAHQQSQGDPRPGTVWRHYKGGLYVIVSRSIFERDCTLLVTYRSNLLQTDTTRTLAEFNEPAVVPGVGEVARFTREPD